MRSLLVWGCFGALLLGGCGLVSGLDSLEIAGDGGVQTAQVQDSPSNPGKDAGADADADAASSDSAVDVKPVDTGIPKDVATDAPCTGTCPSGTYVQRLLLHHPARPRVRCHGKLQRLGRLPSNGTVCTTSSGPKVQTTCSAAINSPATFVNFSSNGDPWLVTVTAEMDQSESRSWTRRARPTRPARRWPPALRRQSPSGRTPWSPSSASADAPTGTPRTSRSSRTSVADAEKERRSPDLRRAHAEFAHDEQRRGRRRPIFGNGSRLTEANDVGGDAEGPLEERSRDGVGRSSRGRSRGCPCRRRHRSEPGRRPASRRNPRRPWSTGSPSSVLPHSNADRNRVAKPGSALRPPNMPSTESISMGTR